MQMIFKYSVNQNITLSRDEALIIFIWSAFYVMIYSSYKLFKSGPIYSPPGIVNLS